ncbi:proteasome inhibitor PI31 subunit isoform X2 [Emydura macquarii macquarii]|uniref:proteasome inhibitor PI31 subunit isoform X2 n=1 Tax=Emydura macquarii macquarii TaxID=1129001 RepID=UPI00352AD415
MAGLELLYASQAAAAAGLSCPQDALLCFVHWQLVTHRYRALGTGDQPGPNERKSEMLPAGWNADKDLYTLRYKSTDDRHELLLKAIMVDSSMILNVMDCGSKQVADLTLTVADYIDPEHLDDFHRVYKNVDELETRVVTGIISPLGAPQEKSDTKKEPKPEKKVPLPPASTPDYDPLRIPPRQPHGGRQPSWPGPLDPFAVGGEDLDPFGSWRNVEPAPLLDLPLLIAQPSP